MKDPTEVSIPFCGLPGLRGLRRRAPGKQALEITLDGSDDDYSVKQQPSPGAARALGGCTPLPRTRPPTGSGASLSASPSGSGLSLASLASKRLKLKPKKKSPQLSPVSQLFLGMGEVSPDIYAIMRLRGRAPVADVAYVMQQLSDAHERFRMRVALRGGVWCTEVVEDFDVNWCMRHVVLDGADIDAAFNAFVARLMSGPPLAEGALPPWDCSVVHYESDPGHTDVLLRCSHMIGDGQLFMQLLKDVLTPIDDEDGGAGGSGDGSSSGDGSARSGGGGGGSGGSAGDGSSSELSRSSGSGGRASGSGAAYSSDGCASSGGTCSGSGGGSAGTAPRSAVAAIVTAEACGEDDDDDGVPVLYPEDLQPAGGAAAAAAAAAVAAAAGKEVESLNISSNGGGGSGGGESLKSRATAAAAAAGGGGELIRAVRPNSAFPPPPSLERVGRKGSSKGRSGSGGARSGSSGGAGSGDSSAGARRRRGTKSPAAAFFKGLGRTVGWFTSACFVVTLPVRIPDPYNSVKAGPGETTGARAFASVSLPLDEMRHVAKLLGVTINTLAVSCIAGGLRRYLAGPGGGGGARRWPWRRGVASAGSGGAGSVPDQLLLCSMVDTRAMQRGKRRGALPGVGAGGCNTLSFIGVPVHTGAAAPLERLGAVDRSLAWIRSSLAVFMAVLIPPVVQFAVRDAGLASRVILYLLPSKTTAGFSNMRGPVKQVALRGHPVVRMYNGVQPNAFGCFLSLMSYNKQVTLVNSCYASKQNARPQDLLDAVHEEWRAVRDAAAAAKGATSGGGGGGGGGGK